MWHPSRCVLGVVVWDVLVVLVSERRLQEAALERGRSSQECLQEAVRPLGTEVPVQVQRVRLEQAFLALAIAECVYWESIQHIAIGEISRALLQAQWVRAAECC